MKIERIEAIPISMELPEVFRGSYYQMTHRCTIITRVYTDSGLVGECYNGDEFERQADLVKIIIDEIQPLIRGESIYGVEACWERMLSVTRDILRDRRLALQAIACVDSAVWDALGKAVGTPLFKLWGGYRDRLQVIAIAGYYRDDKSLSDYGQEMIELKELGLAGCKFKVGGASPEEDAKRVRAAREAVGPDFVLAVDANQGWSVQEAVRFGRLTEDLGIEWFEEPCQWLNDRLAMRDVRFMTGMRVAAGQSEVSKEGCRDLMVAGAIDVCNFDASWGAGPTEWRRVAYMASAFGVQMAHHEEPQIASHLLAGIPNSAYLEVFHPRRDPLFYTLVANRSPFEGGYFEVPNGPGWGLELDKDVIEKYRVDGTTRA